MTSLPTEAPLILRGDPRARGVGQAAGAPRDQVRAATLGRVQAARDAGRIAPDQLDYLQAQYRFHLDHDPEGIAEIDGIADGYGIDAFDLFTHLHLGTLADLAEGAVVDADGCSAWAVGQGPDGPLVVKNRDYSGLHLGVQRVVWHQGPDIATGGMLCVGSLGSPGAYSSGMNAAGLALADSQIGTRRHRVGWLRYFAMTRVLARCDTVATALEMINAAPHAGGGSLILADATGATAAVELGTGRAQVTPGALSMRTNHFLSPELADQTLTRGGGRIAANSAARLACLQAELPARRWDVAAARSLMARHADDPGGAPLCQHAHPDDETSTLSSAIFAIAQRRLYWHPGNPCAGDWRCIPLPD